uniref:Uncharacterized protein n=1 Tax=Setaria italica TaxID=4555 RepID=K3YXJ2_SETIT
MEAKLVLSKFEHFETVIKTIIPGLDMKKIGTAVIFYRRRVYDKEYYTVERNGTVYHKIKM